MKIYSSPVRLFAYSFLYCFVSIVHPITITKPAQAQSSGCGSGLTWYLTPNLWFKEACNHHDDCYDTLDTSKSECDKKFHNEMLEACGREFPSYYQRYTGKRGTCNKLADLYYTTVLESDKARESYNNAQNAAYQRLSFTWSQAGAIPGLSCTRIYEDADPHAWTDNYLCASTNLNLRWSQAGAINGMKCTRVYEDADPAPWGDNYLCAPPSSRVNFQWSQAGAIPGMRCVRVYEDADPHTWGDNYLCY